ncbi:DUF5615 family PIN-like protein [Candidatus Poribacteria bacterium]|jgi:predicted nuclease of predicted toxin-antitoxin system|nr:DUF5615 family PIN-like protein [Candidatus Poribacteria bacterium]MBT5533630.1 DUF5615 family PIN-like protein [Candidatus Poribacteria bacterium]MBT5713280.1 DUF5615 family PIN-like protein [Candidatus Poribacteria bacterium]MBT7097826.1 DUF5615 family PIN-like protein [Candidatus Poribacteria bacterium]MBT7805940.1 DUF5615 family PIN-like protein [Candidatus Poribacteria bacterium]
MGSAPDSDIVDAARRARETIVTHDLDFGHLLAFSGEDRPSVVIMRASNVQAAPLVARLTQLWDQIGIPLSQGAIVVIDYNSARIRRLPVVRA